MTRMTAKQQKRGDRKEQRQKKPNNLIVVRRRKEAVSRKSGVQEPPQLKKELIMKPRIGLTGHGATRVSRQEQQASSTGA